MNRLVQELSSNLEIWAWNWQMQFRWKKFCDTEWNWYVNPQWRLKRCVRRALTPTRLSNAGFHRLDSASRYECLLLLRSSTVGAWADEEKRNLRQNCPVAAAHALLQMLPFPPKWAVSKDYRKGYVRVSVLTQGQALKSHPLGLCLFMTYTRAVKLLNREHQSRCSSWRSRAQGLLGDVLFSVRLW
jgi:hypothetical protein